LLKEVEKLSEFDRNMIGSLTYQEGWASYDKLLNGLIFRAYRQILVDDDIKSAKKLIYFVTALKNIPKSFKNEKTMAPGKDQIQTQGDAAIGIEI